MKRIWGLAALCLCLALVSCSDTSSSDAPREVAMSYINAQLAKDWKEFCRNLDDPSQRGIAGTLDREGDGKSCSEALYGAPEVSQESFAATAQGVLVKDALSQDAFSAKIRLLREVYPADKPLKTIPGQPIEREPDFITEGFLFLEKSGKQWKVSLRQSEIPGIERE